MPEELAAVIDALLAKDPADRPDSADAVRRRLQAVPPSGPSSAGDVPTQPLAPPVTTDVLPVVPPPPPMPTPPTRRPPRRSPPFPWVAGLILGIVLLLVLNALAGGADPAVTARTPAGGSSPSAATPSAARSPSATPVGGGSTADPAAAMIGLLSELGSSEAVDDHLARDLQHGAEEVQRALEDGDGEAILRALEHLRDKVEKGLERGEITPADAQRLDEAIGALASTVGEDQDADEGH
jgi:hypothetical protein